MKYTKKVKSYLHGEYLLKVKNLGPNYGTRTVNDPIEWGCSWWSDDEMKSSPTPSHEEKYIKSYSFEVSKVSLSKADEALVKLMEELEEICKDHPGLIIKNDEVFVNVDTSEVNKVLGTWDIDPEGLDMLDVHKEYIFIVHSGIKGDYLVGELDNSIKRGINPYSRSYTDKEIHEYGWGCLNDSRIEGFSDVKMVSLQLAEDALEDSGNLDERYRILK